MRLENAVLAALAAALLHACGGSDPVTLGDLAERELSAQCSALARCGAVSSEASCKDLLRPALAANLSELSAGVASGTVSYDGDKASQCLDWLLAQPCDQSVAAVRVVPASCGETIKGSLAEGAACAIPAQCASGSCRSPVNCTDSCCPGACAAARPTPAAVGESCTARPCVTGTTCSGSTHTCVALFAEGAACDYSDQCAYGTFCTGTSAQTCTKVPAEGAPCASGRCGATGLVCDKTDHCVRSYGLGAACTVGQSGCAYDLICDPSTSKCSARPGVGSACVNGSCGPGAYCVYDNSGGGLCTVLKANGQACAQAYECQSESCQGKVCADAGACVKK
jgi:hypothetical protein